jgi:FkbM family methyltransferase
MEILKLLRFVWTHPLNANGKLRAIARVVRWQLGSCVLRSPIALPFVNETSLLVSRGMSGATGNWYCGLHESDEMGFLLHLLRPSDHFVDIGANVGSYTILGAGAVGARTTSVEPIPATFEHLRRNVALNRLDDRVRCWCGGLSDRTGYLRFTTALDTVNHVLADGESGTAQEVPVTTLDDLVRDDVPTLIKIDVEGHEYAILKGAMQVLSDKRLLAVSMETNGSAARYGISDDLLIETMVRFDFSPYGYDPLLRRLAPGQPNHGNTIFIRDLDAVQARISSATHYKLVNRMI